MKTRRLTRTVLHVFATIVLVGSSLGAGLPAFVGHASAAGCQPPSIGPGRWKWCGYWYNKFQDTGLEVRVGGVPGTMSTAQAFIDLIMGDLASSDPQHQTEAKYIILNMIDNPLPTPPQPLGSAKVVTAAQIADWQARVRGYADISEDGWWWSHGNSGSIEWRTSEHLPCGTINTYYQPAYDDIAPYTMSDSNTGGACSNPASTDIVIVFRDNAGNPLYSIRRICMNPIGNRTALAVPVPPYNLTTSITATSNGNPLPAGSYVEPGDQVSFSYDVNNSNPGIGTGVGCQAHINDYSGWVPTPAPQTVGPVPPGFACAASYGPGTTHLGTESIASVPNDTSLCRSLIVAPSSPSGGTSAIEVCVYVASKPYFRAYGGDVSAGNPQSNACAAVTKAGIVGWTSGSAGGYGGTASQYAALALDTIYDVATSVGNGAGAAAPPTGLSFAATTASGPDNFGGMFGSGSLPCMPDYYASNSGGGLPSPNLGSALDATGTYTENSPYTISNGTMATAKRIVLYVNGDLTINNDIKYPATWTSADPPLVMVVAKGNIYIHQNAHELDGLYVAQGGTIYTCSNGGTPYNPSNIVNGTFNGPCNSKLVVHGAFIGQQIQLLRTNGTLKQSSAGESALGGAQAEVFDYSPSLWMALPPNAPTVSDYDSITSLPPIL